MLNLKLRFTKIICLALFLLVFAMGCQQKIVCNKPYILVGNSCCLDKNNDEICDKDQQEEFQKNEPAAVDQKQMADTTALRFARAWEGREWSPMYNLFTDELKELKSEERFVRAATKITSREKLYIIRLDELRQDNKSIAYAYYTKSYTASGAERKEPAVKIVQDEDEWKVETFVNYFKACDEFSEKCCGNKICEKTESPHSLKNYSHCPSDCFELDRYVDKSKKETDFTFLGKEYHLQILNFTESLEGNTLKLKYNDQEFTLDEGSYGDYSISHYLRDNIYVKFRYLNNVISITLFNKDE